MTSQRTPQRPSRVTRSLEKGRAILHEAAEHAIKESGASHNAVARWIGRDATTVRRWLAGTSRIDVEAFVGDPRLARAFATCLALTVKRQFSRPRKAMK